MQLTLTQVLKNLKKEGIEITKRTFEFYQKLGLIPKPIKRVGKRGRGVYGYYNQQIILTVKEIFKLKDQGLTLAEITERAEGNVIQRYKKFLKKWGFSDYILSELKGYAPEIVKKVDALEWELGRNLLKKEVQNISEEDLNSFLETRTWDSKFESNFLKELHWYDFDETIEVYVLTQIIAEINPLARGLNSADIMFLKQLDTSKKEKKEIIVEMHRDLTFRIIELFILESKVKVRLAEILGKYEEQTKEEWKKWQDEWESAKNGTPIPTPLIVKQALEKVGL